MASIEHKGTGVKGEEGGERLSFRYPPSGVKEASWRSIYFQSQPTQMDAFP
jgi:hypothetical protein